MSNRVPSKPATGMTMGTAKRMQIVAAMLRMAENAFVAVKVLSFYWLVIRYSIPVCTYKSKWPRLI